MMTDKELLDGLQKALNEKRYTGRCMVRWSRSGRGLRVLETSEHAASGSIRDAIAWFLADREDSV